MKKSSDNQQVDLMKACVFLRLNLSRMGDKRGVSTDVLGEADVDKKFVQIRKKLFKCHEFDAIRTLDNQIRRYVRGHCLPFDPGIVMVPIAKVEEIDNELGIYHAARMTLVGEFSDAWPSIVERIAPKDLRSWFNQEEYQTDGVAEEFWMSWSFYTFSSPTELKDVAPAIFKAESEKLKQRMDEAFDTIRQVQAEAFLQLVSHLRDKLESDINGTPKRLSASTVRNLQEFINEWSVNNVTNYNDLGQYVERARSLLEGRDAEEFRTTDGLRLRVGAELAAIEQSIDRSITSLPKRRITRGQA